MTIAGSNAHRELIGVKHKTGIDISRLLEYISTIESKTIDLILIGVDPKNAKRDAIIIIDKRWRKKNADKSGG